MKKKIFGIFVCMLLIGTFLTVSGNDNYNKIANKENNQITTTDDVDWWPMFHHDLESTGYTTSSAPTTNGVLWKIGNWENGWDCPRDVHQW